MSKKKNASPIPFESRPTGLLGLANVLVGLSKTIVLPQTAAQRPDIDTITPTLT